MTPQFCKLPEDYEIGNAKRELDSQGIDYSDQPLWVFAEELWEATASPQQFSHYETVLDWASQIREKENLDWVSALKAAEVFYFG